MKDNDNITDFDFEVEASATEMIGIYGDRVGRKIRKEELLSIISTSTEAFKKQGEKVLKEGLYYQKKLN